jgi:hypothetical protein
MPRGGKREKAGRKKQERPVDSNLARKIKAQIGAEAKWLRIIEIETRTMEEKGHTGPLKASLIYLDNRDLGNTVDTVNHLHDKPLELQGNFSISLTLKKARERVMQAMDNQ